MIKNLRSNLYQIKVKLPNSPLKVLNSYVIKGEERNLIIDTGFNRPECKKIMENSLKKIGVNLEETDFFITHMHSDHAGLVDYLATEKSKIFCSYQDGKIISAGQDSDHWQKMKEFARLNGFPEQELIEVISKHPGFKYAPNVKQKIDFVQEGVELKVGDYQFVCLETPGHTQGQICLYESNKKILIAGDLILADITPSISLWSNKNNPLKQYLKSLDRVCKLEIEFVLSGHRQLIKNYKERILELKDHHNDRLNQILNIIESGSWNAYQVSAQMDWDMTYKSWEQFPISQKWFATGEVISHLQYLVHENKLRRVTSQDEISYYRL